MKVLPQDVVRIIRRKLAELAKSDSDATQHEPLCPVDERIQAYLNELLAEVCPDGAPQLPRRTLVLDRPGIARLLSLPAEKDRFTSPYLTSYRVAQGILNNPKSDRRTTQGVFHIAEGGLPIPDDKIGVPKQTYAALLARALTPPADVAQLPYTAEDAVRTTCFVSLLMRPLVCPATPTSPAKSMEIRFFAPGTLVSNLDFVEGIFGNGGDPYQIEKDAALDVEHWSGHTGCVILAPHLIGLKKKDLGLPPSAEATARQRRDGMCWADENEIYNGGNAFKITSRDARGVMVTIIADNYYGYCKKEVKTQISFAANLFGLAEEEHAGGAIAYPTYILGQEFHAKGNPWAGHATFEEALARLGERAEALPGRFAVDHKYRDVYYVPEDASFNAREGIVYWKYQGERKTLPLRKGDVYILPSGYKVRLEKQIGGSTWRLVGSRPDGTLCHKPCTVSGGGKSEISKSLSPLIQKGPVFVKDFKKDFDAVEEILNRDYSGVYLKSPDERAQRPLLSPERSIGSVVKLFTPSPNYTEEHNVWLRQLPQTIRQLIFVVKRYYRSEWGSKWRDHFSVDRINGYMGHELKFEGHKLVANYLRVGFDADGSWRTVKLRPDFNPADKVQVEDDITASVVVPRGQLPALDPAYDNPSVKLVQNCESLLFQRPDDAIHRGFDLTAEADLATPETFISNFEPLDRPQVQAMIDHVVEFDLFSEPMKKLLEKFAESGEPAYAVSSAHPRIVDGKPSKNPRYLQRRPDLVHHRETYIAEMGARLARRIPAGEKAYFPVNAVLSGRRNNPRNAKIGLPALAVYNPIHYQELPELFMDFVCSLTGKSPSTTGFGSEGALTKGPFNALPPVADLNNALLSFILTGYAGFTSAAGHVGPNFRVDHDISMLVPEVWCRMNVKERDPRYLIENGLLEKLNDFQWEGRKVLAGRLGYRITSAFVDRFFGRLFETPAALFTEEMLKPEKQDLQTFVEGVESIVEAQTRVAKLYFADGGIEMACPPLRALLTLMAEGSWEGKGVNDPAFRALFDRTSVLQSAWYRERLKGKQRQDVALWTKHLTALEAAWVAAPATSPLNFKARVVYARKALAHAESKAYLAELEGSLGLDPFAQPLHKTPSRQTARV